MVTKDATVRDRSDVSGSGASFEIIDARELAKRLKVPVSWVRQRATSPRFLAEQRIPHIRFGRYIRFLWESPQLKSWIAGCSEQ